MDEIEPCPPISPDNIGIGFKTIFSLVGPCRSIINETARKYGVTPEEILGERRTRRLIPARHEAIYRCVAETQLSLSSIGHRFHRDHSTVGYAVMKYHYATGAPLPRGMNWSGARYLVERIQDLRPEDYH